MADVIKCANFDVYKLRGSGRPIRGRGSNFGISHWNG